MEYYSTTKKEKGTLPFAVASVNLEGVTLGDTGQAEND